MTAILTRLVPNDLRGSRWFPLAEERQDELRRTHHDLIQRFASTRLEPDDYIVGEMLLCNDDTDYYYSKFSSDALREITEQLPGAPVMESHNYDGQAVGLFFNADVVERPVHGVRGKSRQWVRANYILPNDEGGQAIAKRVKLGIRREVSIGWRCAGAECSECGQHIARCEHAPGDIYEQGLCRFTFSGITNVLEGSFVFRGGQKDTVTFIPEGESGDMAASIAGAASRFVGEFSGDVDWRGIGDVKRSLAAANVALAGRRHLRALGRGYLRAAGYGLMCAKPGDRQNVQTLRLARDRFETPGAAARWARDHDFRADRRKETATTFEFEQFEAAKRTEKRLVTLDEGVVARVMEVEEKQERRRAVEADRTLDEVLS